MEKNASIQVKAVPSSATENQIFSAIYVAWEKVFGTKPTLNQVANTWAQIGIETGRGKYILNNNVGNINWTNGNSHNYYMTHDDRSVNGNPANRERYSQARRSYDTLIDGVTDYLTLLKNRPGVMKTLMSDATPQEFSHALAEAKYYDPYVRDDYVDNNGKKNKGYTSHLMSLHDDFIKKYNDKKIAFEAPPNTQIEPKTEILNPSTPSNKIDQIENLLNKFLGAIASKTASDRHFIKKAYKNNLLPNDLIIKISSNDFDTSIEFARILCTALDEDLYTNGSIHTDRNNVEVACTIYGPKQLSIEAALQLCDALSEVFEDATQKIGGCRVSTIISPNKKTNYQELDIKLAQICYNNFHLKFIKE